MTPSKNNIAAKIPLSAQKRILHDALSEFRELSAERKQLITWSYGLDGISPMTLRQLGKALDISHERVRQIRDETLLLLVNGHVKRTIAGRRTSRWNTKKKQLLTGGE